MGEQCGSVAAYGKGTNAKSLTFTISRKATTAPPQPLESRGSKASFVK
ncbi:hypothetical protein [Helicobacter canis]|nr:hypothetical protein [Helicobacter canis]